MTELPPIYTELWRFAATILVLAMQAGFLLLEAGSVRAKNSVNVAQKNVTDLVISWILFLVFGYSIGFGLPSPMWASADSFSITSFLFQLGFCGAAATIIAGAVAERMGFAAYAWLTCAVVAIIYPLAVWLCWGNLLVPDRASPLADMGFVDFAGGTVVHVLAACVALAAIIQLGPRLGRFTEEGKVRTIPGHSPVLAMLGLTILLIGWFGFNAGGLSPGDPRFAQTLLSTATAACFGALPALAFGYALDKKIFNPRRTINGLLGGLVCVTACAGFADTWHAALLGVVGGTVATFASDWLLTRYSLDDPLDVVAVHGLPGAIGTLSVAVLLPKDQLLGGSWLMQLGIQTLGLVIVSGFAFIVAWIWLKALAKFMRLRVSAEDEHLGLNYTEHGVSIDTQRLKRAIDTQLSTGTFSDGLQMNSDIYDEAGEVAESLNALLARNEQARATISQQASRFQHFANTTTDYLWETNANLALVLFSSSSQQGLLDAIPTNGTLDLFGLFNCSTEDEADNRRRIARHEPLLSFRARLEVEDLAGIRMLEVSGVPYFDDNGILMGYRGGASDVTDRQLAEERAHYLAYHDDLTGLGNRRALTASLSKRFAAAHGEQNIVVAGIDLDGFKEVNDAYGHMVGDKLLERVSERLSGILRSQDEVYRTGGDEFIAVLEGFDGADGRENAAQWCLRIIEKLKEPVEINGHVVAVGASVGISLFPEDSRGQEDLIRMADIAMYQAKVNGKGQVVPFAAAMDEEAKRRRKLESALHEAFARREFFVAYQPKINIGSGEIMGFEALIRWLHPERGELSPAEFLPAIERLQLMPELGDYVLHEACKFAASWERAGIQIAVNISPVHLVAPGFLATLDSALHSSGLDPQKLEIEVTEEALITDFEHTRIILEEVHRRGISIAVDDFGRGNTSLRYLQQFPLDKLKIDKSFIRNIVDNDKAREIARSVVRLGHDLGLSVVAEGVEQQAQLNELSDWKCDEAQGFLFSRPVEQDAVHLLLDDSRPMSKKG